MIMDVRYLIQILLLILFFIGIHCVVYQRQKAQCRFVKIILKVECQMIYRRFSKHIEKKKICAFEKYQIWRYIEKRREASFIG